jgi:polyisoprenoid-binding protein YceI
MTNASTWTIDPTHSSVGLAVRHMMFTTVRGRFKDVKGTISVDPTTPGGAAVNVEIGAASIDTGVADRDAHLRSADFFDAEKHPLLTFRSKRIEGAFEREGDPFAIVGDLTIGGTTKEVSLDAVYEGSGKDPWGGTRAGARAATKIDRRDWGLTWNQALETGGLLVANEVRIDIELQAVRG